MKHPVLCATALLLAAGLAGCSSTGSEVAAGTSPSAKTGASSSQAPDGAAAAAAAAAPRHVGDVVDFAAVTKTVSSASKAKGTTHIALSMAGGGALQMDVDLRNASVRESVDVGGPSLVVLIVDKKAYIGGGIAKTFGAKTPWVQIDPQGTDKVSKQLAPVVASLATAAESSDPAASLSPLADAKATVTASSTTSTTYRVKLTAAQLAELAKKQPALAKAGGQPVTFDYTVTSAGLPQKIGITVGGKTIVTTYSGWGAPLKITAPPASQVTLTSAITAAA